MKTCFWFSQCLVKKHVLYSVWRLFPRVFWGTMASPSIQELVVHESEHRAAGLREVLGVLGPGASGNRAKVLAFSAFSDKIIQNPDGGFLKWGYLQIIHFNRVFHYKPSILGYPHGPWLLKPPDVFVRGAVWRTGDCSATMPYHGSFHFRICWGETRSSWEAISTDMKPRLRCGSGKSSVLCRCGLTPSLRYNGDDFATHLWEDWL